jgi:uncharacterized membrane protein
MTIKNPIEWSGARVVDAAHLVRSAGHSLHHIQDTFHAPAPAIRHIRVSDLRDVLRQGMDDFGAYRSDVLFLCTIYPVIGLLLARFAAGMNLIPLVFPLASGFAIVGPFAAVGLYEMSRLREQGVETRWINAFDVFKAPAIGAISVLGLLLIAIFLVWIATAWTIFQNTLGPTLPTSIGAFLHDVFRTPQGQTMIVVGVGIGFLFALLAMAISLVSFPLLLDRDTGLDTAIKTSVRAVAANPGPMAAWGLIVAGCLVLGSIPLFVGLAVAVPILGHSTWHLYRKLVAF